MYLAFFVPFVPLWLIYFFQLNFAALPESLSFVRPSFNFHRVLRVFTEKSSKVFSKNDRYICYACFGRHAKSPSFTNFGTWGGPFGTAPVFFGSTDPANSIPPQFSAPTQKRVLSAGLLAVNDINPDTDQYQADN